MTKSQESGHGEITDAAKREHVRTKRPIQDILLEWLRQAKQDRDRVRVRKIVKAQKFLGIRNQQKRKGEVMNWYAAHIVMFVKFKRSPQHHFPIWENVVLIKAKTVAEAFDKAEKRGREEEADDDPSFRWGGRPAEWVFAGVRKIARCDDFSERPKDGTEVTFLEVQAASLEDIDKLLLGKTVALKLTEKFDESDAAGELVPPHSDRFREMLEASRHPDRNGQGIPHAQFWKELDEEYAEEDKRRKQRPKRRAPSAR